MVIIAEQVDVFVIARWSTSNFKYNVTCFCNSSNYSNVTQVTLLGNDACQL